MTRGKLLNNNPTLFIFISGVTDQAGDADFSPAHCFTSRFNGSTTVYFIHHTLIAH